MITRRGYALPKNTITLEELDNLKKKLTVKPNVDEDYCGVPESFELFIEDDQHIFIPPYFAKKRFDTPVEYDLGPITPTTYNFLGRIRDYQIDIVNVCMEKLEATGGGLISLSCGLGKTVIGIRIASLLKVKTLVIIHTKRLLNQWIDRITTFTNAKIGIIKQKRVEVDADIVVGMLQSVSMRDYDSSIFDGFGLVIYDEAHHAPSRVFSRALQKTGTRYTIALTATPKRKDGLTKVMTWYLGDLMYKLIREGDSGVIVNTFTYESSDKKLFAIKKRAMRGKTKPDVVKMVSNISEIKERNMFITNIITYLRKYERERQILVLGERISQLEELIKMTNDALKLEENDWYRASLYIGKMKEAELDDAKNANVLFASFKMAAEGLDIESLNTLIFASPKKEIEQSIGRILRKTVENRTVFPMVIDIADNIQVFNNWSVNRAKFYKNNNYTIRKYRGRDDVVIDAKQYLLNCNVVQDIAVLSDPIRLRRDYVSFVYGDVECDEDMRRGEISYYEDEFSYPASLDVLIPD